MKDRRDSARVFVRLHVATPHRHSIADALVDRGHGLVEGPAAPGFVPVSSPQELADSTGPVWLRPTELGGPGSAFTALVLIRAAARSGRPWVCEGLSVRAAAAALAVGAVGVVVDTPLWGCAETDLAPDVVALLAQAGTADSVVEGELGAGLVRKLVRGPRSIDAPQTVGDARPGLGRPLLEVLDGWVSELHTRLAAARKPVPRTVAAGPMANVTERVGLARVLAARGVLPFLAMGALEPARVAALLAEWGDLGAPFGVGLIGFDVMPHRDAHLDAVRAATPRPSAVTIAGGTAALACRLQSEGFEAWLHTPSARTVEAAFDAGVRTVVLEGHEAGGHVGRTTSAGLWEDGLAIAEQRPDRQVVLAGGIGDAVSAAFATAMAAPFVQAGGSLVLQAGTAFLLTHEAAELGHVTATYQAEALRATRTVLVGSTVNLPLRCVPNAYTEATRAEEQALEAAGVPRAERRLRLEHHNLGRTRLAAQGIERDPEWSPGSTRPRHHQVPATRQRAEAAFTVGQGALVTGRLGSVPAVVRALTRDADALLAGTRAPTPFPQVARLVGAPEARRTRAAPGREGDVAIVGLGCVVPGALDVPSYWRNLLAGRSAIDLVPAGRWSEQRYYDASAGATGPTLSYARLAGAVRGFVFDPLPFRIPPRIVPTIDPSQRLALVAAAEALKMAGWDRPSFDRRRAAVVLGNAMGGEFSKSMAVRIRFREVLDAVARDELGAGWSIEDLRALEARVEASLAPHLPPVEVDSMAGLLSNVVAGRVAAWLDWMGGNLTVDAACAASLASVTVAVDWLRSGRCDAVLAGGVDTDLSPESYVGFCRTEALSPTGSQPFSARADGFVMGEGAAVLALVRLEDARRAGQRVLAVIRGVGQSSDGRGRGITAPRPEGQDLAIERAWAESGLTPRDLGMIEAHGTGTAKGDETEIGVLARRFADANTPTWLGSVKSMIGHLKGAAGAAALVKATLSLASGVVPPTLHAGPVHPDLPLLDGPLRLPRLAAPLPRPAAAVSAFGFGGTNFHVVLAGGDGADPHPAVTRSAWVGRTASLDRAWGRADVTRTLTAWGADDDAGLRASVAAGRNTRPEDVARCAVRVVALSAPGEDPSTRVLRVLDGGRDAQVWRGRGAPAPVHLVFPGQGAQESADDTATRRMPAALAAWGLVGQALQAALGRDLDTVLAEARSGDPVAVHAASAWFGVAHPAALRQAGIPIASVLGHSLGAFPAAVAAGAWSWEEVVPLVLARGAALAACPEGRMVAVRQAPEPLPTGLSIAAVNADDQVVLCGAPEVVEALARTLGPTQARLLTVRRAYHGPSVAPAAEALAAALASRPARPFTVPMISTHTGRPVTSDALAADLVASVSAPVRFLEALHAAGADGGVFVDVGPGDTLSALAHRAGYAAVSMAGADGPARTAAALLAAGHAGLALDLPATAVDLALPAFVPNVAPRPVASAARAPAADPRAEALLDLRIAALADPSLLPDYHAARRVFVREVLGTEPPSEVVAPPPPAPAPIPAAAPAQPPPAVDDVRAAVIATICEVTGYPPDWVTDGADLEADLGVDSIRKMEILGALEKRFAFSTPEGEYHTLGNADLGSLVAHVTRHRGGPAPSPAALETASAVYFSVPEVQPRTPPAPDLDVARALAALQQAMTTPNGAVPPLRTDPAGLAGAAWLRSFARETGRAVDHGGALPTGSWALEPPEAASLPQGLVVLATGGLRGILAPCLASLADLAPRVVLLHRPGSVVDGAALPFEVVAVPGDVTVLADVERAVSAALSRFGALDLVVHAAGSLRDGPWDHTTPEDRAAVLGPKWTGARNLAEATAALPLRGFVTFSSLVAHLGNPGQTTYAAANAAMETVRHPLAPTLHLEWTAWSDVGMAAAPGLARMLAARGIHPLTPAAGAAAFRRLIGSPSTGVVRISAQPLPDTAPPPWPLGPLRSRDDRATTFHLPLDPDAPWLADHRVGDRPLVPAACWVGAMLGGAHFAEGGSFALEALEVLVPTFVDRVRTDVVLVLARAADGLDASVTAGGATVCRGRLRRAAPAADHAPPGPTDPSARDARPLYRPDLLFHGRSWQVLDRVWGDGDRFSADLRAGTVPSVVAASIDGIHQLLATLGDRQSGWLGLPVGALRWEGRGEGIPVRVEGIARTVGRELTADVVALDAAGRVVVAGRGVRIRAARTTHPGEVADA
jgi:acyl transferase domain-containing protein/NAD(P)H-dependent flavin oxidoreductase YrpB (nitropropane dioxygenase family)/acyl carrier protein